MRVGYVGFLLPLLFGLLTAPILPAETPEERLAFDAALRSFQSGFAEKAAADLAAFRTRHPMSTLVPDAVLYEAKARVDLGQRDAAARLLEERLESIGSLKDQALHLIGEIHLRRPDFPAAAKAFRRLLSETPNSALVLQAAFGEAFAHYRAGDYPRAIQLLSNPTNAFLSAASAKPNDDLG
ncbi:MAG: tetratricopeptide repeat protein, partial [Verrucomicrobiales bacterium]|nr:tetratricopeptide repeat protein [Verrucomicrobiales bacterium]